MKTKILLMAAIAATMAFASCSKEDAPAGDPQGAGILFDLAPQAGLTRADGGRDLYSSEALQNVTDMQVYAFKKTGEDFIYTTVTVGATAGQVGYTVPWAEGTTKKQYKITPKLTAGDAYKFLAVGLDAGKTNFAALSLANGVTNLNDVVLALNASAKNREAFAGVSAETVIPAGEAKVNVEITLKRVVAGVLGYFVNIPAKIADVEVKSVAVVLHATPNSTVNLTTGAGSVPVGSLDLITLEIPADAQTVNGAYTFTQTGLPATVTTDANSLLGGIYAMPIAAPTAGEYTMQVQLRDAASNTLKTWAVKIDAKQSVDSDENKKLYSLLANHFYSIGKKSSDKPTGPDEPDEPADLSKDQDLVLTVNPNWETVHNMELE